MAERTDGSEHKKDKSRTLKAIICLSNYALCRLLMFDLLQTSFAVRDRLINFALFTVVSFGAVVQLNTLLWQMWMAESRAKMVTLNYL